MDVWLFLLFLRNPPHKGQSITLFKQLLLGNDGIVVSPQTWKMRPQVPHWQALRYAVSPEWIQVWSVFVWKSWQTAQAPQGHWAPPSWECRFALVLTGSVEVAEWGSLLLCVLGLLAIETARERWRSDLRGQSTEIKFLNGMWCSCETGQWTGHFLQSGNSSNLLIFLSRISKLNPKNYNSMTGF